MLRRALPFVVVLVLCAGSTGCKLVSVVATTEGSEGRSDDGAFEGSDTASSSDSDGDSDSNGDEEEAGDDDGWDTEDDD